MGSGALAGSLRSLHLSRCAGFHRVALVAMRAAPTLTEAALPPVIHGVRTSALPVGHLVKLTIHRCGEGASEPLTGAVGGLSALRELELDCPLRTPGGALWSGDMSGLFLFAAACAVTLRQCELARAGAWAAAPHFAPRLRSVSSPSSYCPRGGCGAALSSGRRRERRWRQRFVAAAAAARW